LIYQFSGNFYHFLKLLGIEPHFALATVAAGGVDQDERPSCLILDGNNHGLLAKEGADCVIGRGDVYASDCAVIGSH
jgi:hypothetical protein